MWNALRRPFALAVSTGLMGMALATTAGTAQAAAPRTVATNHGCTYYYGTELTMRGNTGPRVKQVQCILVKMAWLDPGDVDGIFGPVTEGAVKKMQSDASLTPDGIVGVQTWAALRS